MKKLLPLLLALVLVACSSGNKESGSQDSVVSYNDTIAAAVVNETAVSEETQEQASDTSQLEITYDETAGLVFERQEPYYTVSIVTKQYEASSDVTWYFDNDFSPIYFKQDWASEGGEGSTEFFVKNGDVQCARVVESYGEGGGDTEKWCSTTGGTITRFDVGIAELLPADHGRTYTINLEQFLDTLKAILKEAEKTSEDENSYTLRIEKTVNYGQEYTESTEVSIPKKVYDSIMN